MRFVADTSSVTNVAITRAMLLNLWEVALTSNTATRLFNSVKLLGVETWAPTANNGGFNQGRTSIEWVGDHGPSVKHSDAGMTINPGHVSTSPPPESSARWWSTSGVNESEDLFLITLPVGGVVDVFLLCSLFDNEAPVAGDAPTGATAGKQYGNYLDGLSGGTLLPEGVAVLP